MPNQRCISQETNCGENQISCNFGEENWCCDKFVNNILQQCDTFRECAIRPFESWDEEGLGIRWLDLENPMPQECTPENSVLVIFGDATTTVTSASRDFFLYELSKYNEKKAENGDCTFGTRAVTSEEFDNLVYNPNNGVSHIGKFKDLIVLTHGCPRGTYIETGSNFGSLIAGGGKVTLISCLVGEGQFFGLLVPRTVENFCSGALSTSKIKLSETVVAAIPELDENGKMFYSTEADWKCYECTQQNPPKSRSISCDNF